MKVCELDTPHEVVVLRNEEGKRFRIPLAEFDEPEEGMNRPKSIGDKFYDYSNKENEIVITASFGDTGTFTVADKLAEEGQIHHNKIRRVETVVEPEPEPEVEDKRPGSTLRRRRRIRNKAAAGSSPTVETEATEATPVVRKAEPLRKAEPAKEAAKEAAKESAKESKQEEKPATNSRRRRRRSGKAKEAAAPQAAASASSAPAKPASKGSSAKQTAQSKAPAGTAHRRARRRSHRTGGDSNES